MYSAQNIQNPNAVSACKKLISFVLLGASLFTSAAFADEVLDQAVTLIKAKDYKAAYSLLEPLESERAGDVEYDYLLGLAGVEGGEVTRGIFALERVLAIKPNHIDARAMIAKGYYRSGETENAKTEFENLKLLKPSPELSKIIENNLTALDKATGQTTAFAAYLEPGIGYDSNINSATSLGSVLIGATPINLANNSREQSSSFLSMAGGASFRTPLFGSRHFSFFGSAAGNQRMNWHNENFDTGSHDFTLGLNYKKFIDSFSLAYQSGTFYVDSGTFRKSDGLLAQWRRDVDDQNQVSVFAQYADIEFPSNNVRNAERAVLGVSWGHVFAGDKAPIVYLSPYLGKEDAKANGSDHLSNDLYGLRLTGQYGFNYRWIGFAGVGYEYRDYDSVEPLFGVSRKDDQYDASLGVRFLPGHDWTIKPQISYVRNDSNVDLFGFERTIISVNFRKDFNW